MMVRIGDVVPREGWRGLWGSEFAAPQWFILTTPPQKEDRARRWLRRQSVPEADTWYPTERAWRAVPGPRRKVEYARRVAPGYLFARFGREPAWDVLFAHDPGCLSGVVSRGDVPYAVPERVLLAMRQVPERIRELREAAEAEAEAAREASRPRPGHRARITRGPLAGWTVDVTRIDRGLAAFLLGGVEATTDADALERVA